MLADRVRVGSGGKNEKEFILYQNGMGFDNWENWGTSGVLEVGSQLRLVSFDELDMGNGGIHNKTIIPNINIYNKLILDFESNKAIPLAGYGKGVWVDTIKPSAMGFGSIDIPIIQGNNKIRVDISNLAKTGYIYIIAWENDPPSLQLSFNKIILI